MISALPFGRVGYYATWKLPMALSQNLWTVESCVALLKNKFDQLRAILQLPALKIFKLLFVGEVLRFVSQESN